jgi:hypothetical protein
MLLHHFKHVLLPMSLSDVHEGMIVETRFLAFLIEDLMPWHQIEPLLIQAHILSQFPVLFLVISARFLIRFPNDPLKLLVRLFFLEHLCYFLIDVGMRHGHVVGVSQVLEMRQFVLIAHYVFLALSLFHLIKQHLIVHDFRV